MDNIQPYSEWINLSAAWIKEAREGKNPTRNGLLDKSMLEECGNVQHLKILDCGCGEGRFCRILSKAGAEYVLGIDVCEPMIKAANEIKSENEEYKIADAQNLEFIQDDTFDIVISYLNQCDLPDFKKNNEEVYRILKKNGHFIVANLHPMRSAVGGWQRNAQNKKEHVILDNYFDESERHWQMMGADVTNYHRTLSSYINSYISVGFSLYKIIEPTVNIEQLKAYPELEDELRVPNFIICNLKK